ncbi:protein of unknown function (plasmid) [Shinella sp. WSC3-e]|nr:protein of unknown function [Shinella sp. WSC3-e]
MSLHPLRCFMVILKRSGNSRLLALLAAITTWREFTAGTDRTLYWATPQPADLQWLGSKGRIRPD